MNRRDALAALAATDPIAESPLVSPDPDDEFAAIVSRVAAIDVLPAEPFRPSRPHRTRSLLVATVVLVAVLVAAGVIVRQVTHHAGAPALSPTATASVSADHRLQQAAERLGVDLQPPRADDRPTLSQADAIAACHTPDNICPQDSTPVTATLARATTDSMGQIQPDGSIHRTIDDRLVWAVTWSDECIASGGPGLGDSTPPPPTPVPCTYLVLIDADSGAGLFNGSGG